MRHVLNSILAFHWTAAFGLLAMIAVLEGDGGLAAVLTVLGAQADVNTPLLSLVTSFGLALAAVVFFWAFVTVAFSRHQDKDEGPTVMQLAFAVGAVTTTVLLVIGALQPVAGLFPAIATILAALLASYVAAVAERSSSAQAVLPVEDDVRATARVMAAGAAHSTMLTRISGRSGQEEGR